MVPIAYLEIGGEAAYAANLGGQESYFPSWGVLSLQRATKENYYY